MKILPLTVGADPEAFVSKLPRNSFVSADGLIPGTKSEPYKVVNGAVQVDGMAAEFNIDPAGTAEQFVSNLLSVISQLGKMLPADHSLSFVPVASFSRKVWDEVSETAKELGCDPDFNAYTGNVNPRPDGDRLYRTAAGHVHVGWTEGMDPTDPGHITACRMLARQMDFYLGVPALLIDSDHKRRSLYGAAGAFRIKPYGVEYRVLSNAWLKDPELMTWVFNNTKLAFDNLMAGEDLFAKYQDFAKLVIDVQHHGKLVDEDTALDIQAFYEKALGIPLPPKKFWVVQPAGE